MNAIVREGLYNRAMRLMSFDEERAGIDVN